MSMFWLICPDVFLSDFLTFQTAYSNDFDKLLVGVWTLYRCSGNRSDDEEFEITRIES